MMERSKKKHMTWKKINIHTMGFTYEPKTERLKETQIQRKKKQRTKGVSCKFLHNFKKIPEKKRNRRTFYLFGALYRVP